MLSHSKINIFPVFPTFFHVIIDVNVYLRRIYLGVVGATVLFSAFVIGFCYSIKHYSGPVWEEGGWLKKGMRCYY